MGATQLECKVRSLTRAAGSPPIMTVVEPMTTLPGPAGTQPARRQGAVVLPICAAGKLPTNTVNAPVMIGIGRDGCGTGVGTGAGGWIGAWQWGVSCLTMSPTRAADGIVQLSFQTIFSKTGVGPRPNKKIGSE
jgi:hypothetical protein